MTRKKVQEYIALSEKATAPPRLQMLTKRQREVLTIMRDKDEELVYEKGRGYLGYSPVSPGTVMQLLRLAAIRMEDGAEVGKFERYTINETGRKILEVTDGK